jgi:bla regulator protein blaR1
MENLLKPEIVSALGWTLVHSIWQGIVLAVLYFVLSKFLKSAQTKYQIGVGALLAQFALAIGTFYYLVDFNKEVFNGVSGNVLQYFSNFKNTPSNLSMVDSIQLFLTTNLSLIVQVWVIGVSIFFMKLTLDIWFVNRLKIKGLQDVDALTKSKFNQLIERLEIRQKIQIFESNQTLSPIVIGNLKPFILLPIGLVSGLTINELEAILAHELAHIKRYDFLVNILQSVIEIMFFFNPAIWWISSQIRVEREHCCDDFSVSITGDKMLLVNALAQVESFRVNQPLAMAFGKKKMTLLNRVKRILGVKQPQNQSIESVMLMVLVSVICGGLLIFKSDEVAAKADVIAKKVENLYARNEVIQEDLKATQAKEVQQLPAIKVDTTITEIEKDTQEYFNNHVTDDNGRTRKYMSSNSRRGSFWIDRNGDIFIDGRKYDAPPALLTKIKPYLKKMDVLSAEMDIYGKEMGKFGDEMGIYGKKMNDKNAPMSEYGRLLEAQGKLLEEQVKLQTKFSLKASLAEIDNDKANQEANRKLEKEHEKRVDEISKEMDRLGKEMDRLGKEMENDGKPMEAIGKKMEAEGKKMEVVGKKMELVAKDIFDLLPADLKAKIKDIEKGFNK